MVSERELIQATLQGNHEAFNSLVQKHGPQLNAAIRRVVTCESDADDIVQEAFLTAFQKLHQFQGRSSFYTWLYRIARNYVSSQLRKRRLTLSLAEGDENSWDPPGDVNTSPAHTMQRREQIARVRSALTRLSPAHRAALRLRIWQQLEYEDIASQLQIRAGTAKSRVHRGKQLLRAELAELASV